MVASKYGRTPWNALSDGHSRPRNVFLYWFGLQAGEGVHQLPL